MQLSPAIYTDDDNDGAVCVVTVEYYVRSAFSNLLVLSLQNFTLWHLICPLQSYKPAPSLVPSR